MKSESDILEVSDVHTYYGESYVLQGVDLSLPRGKVVALLGRNGVGKTTLVRSIMGMTPARRGAIRFLGDEITHTPSHRIAQMGIGSVPQGRHVFGSLTVAEHLEVFSRGDGAWTADHIYEVFPNLKRRSGGFARKLSGGEQQMLATARALVGNPKLLIMDEPTEGLSPFMIKELGKAIESLKMMGTSILIVEQRLNFALRHSDQIFIMSKGRIVHHCTPGEIAANADLKKEYLGI